MTAPEDAVKDSSHLVHWAVVHRR